MQVLVGQLPILFLKCNKLRQPWWFMRWWFMLILLWFLCQKRINESLSAFQWLLKLINFFFIFLLYLLIIWLYVSNVCLNVLNGFVLLLFNFFSMAFIDCLHLPCEIIIHFVNPSLFIILKINFHLSDFLLSHSLDFVSFLIKKGLHVLNLFFIGFNDLLSLVF